MDWRERAWKHGPIADTVAAIRRYDPDLQVVWNPALPVRRPGTGPRTKPRWSLYRSGPLVAKLLDKSDQGAVCTLARLWVPVMVVEEADGFYRELDERVLHDLHRMDWRKHYDMDAKRAARAMANDLDRQLGKHQQKREDDFTEDVRTLALEYHRELRDGFERDLARQGKTL